MAPGAPCQALAFTQVPAVMSRVHGKAGHMALGVSPLMLPSTRSWAFLYLQEKVIALDLTGWAWPLMYHRAALWNEASAVVSWRKGRGTAEREGGWSLSYGRGTIEMSGSAIYKRSEIRGQGDGGVILNLCPHVIKLSMSSFYAFLSAWCFWKKTLKNRTPSIFGSSLDSIQARSVHTDISCLSISRFHFRASAP